MLITFSSNDFPIMGRNKGKQRWKNQRKKQKQIDNENSQYQPDRRNNNKKDSGDDFVLTTVLEGNYKMEAYYALQGLHHSRWQQSNNTLESTTKSLSDWDAERRAWRRTSGEILHASFRFCQTLSTAVKQDMEKELRAILQRAREWRPPPTNAEADAATATKEAPSADGQTKDGEKSSPAPDPDPLMEPLAEEETKLYEIPFCEHAYQLAIDRNRMRKHHALKPLQAWIVQQTECGHITRQETVSMIPPIVLMKAAAASLPEQPGGLSILDMCAAPGSKTSQLLEGMASRAMAAATQNSGSVPTDILDPRMAGVLVANDVNPQRANMLTHQLKRIMHQFPVAVVTAAPAQSLSLPKRGDAAAGDQAPFDLVLADVPCSGDGTSRKNINIWKSWSQAGALALHKLQLDIAWKGVAQLCQVGTGHVCYSTCSQNPVENEAVVAELLRRAKGSLELVDCREAALGSFRTRPGWSTWKVLCEGATRREQKNRANKNKPKMLEKRRQYEEKARLEKERESGGGGEVKDGEGDDKEATENAENKTDSMEADAAAAASPAPAKKSPPILFEPTSTDEDHLLELATGASSPDPLMHFKSMDEVPPELTSRIRQSCFPPTDEEANQFHLERCIRCLAHDNNTGSFFVALLRKVGPVSGGERRLEQQRQSAAAAAAAATEGENDDGEAKDGPSPKRAKLSTDEKETEESSSKQPAVDTAATESTDNKGDRQSNRRRRGMGGGQGEYIPVQDDVMDPLIEYYGLVGPTFRKDLFMARANSDSKVISFIAPSVKDLVFVDSVDNNNSFQHRLNIIATGLKAFVKNSILKNEETHVISHRIAQEACHFLVPFMSKRKFTISLDDFEACLKGQVSAKNNDSIQRTDDQAAEKNPSTSKQTDGTDAKQADNTAAAEEKKSGAEESGEAADDEKTGSAAAETATNENKNSKSKRPQNITLPLSDFSQSFADQARALDVGAFVVVLEGYENVCHEEKMVLVMWRCRGDHVNTLVSKAEVDAIQSKLSVLKREGTSTATTTTS